ncbi:hypothetical protein GCM10011341_37970 [Frigidibacter albus]|uniref:hypothetical protein n=1 Tax=Frigidibacter albus TaxID=1465486 RepID=UPI0013D57592|nr:hypothetical protein [Frigidibacter albus]GGH63125.1 hypothetical protein GCM10011341_37970 [Frigidibacter albus]
MEREAGKKQGKTAADGREARLKAALKANLARRKGQAKARAAADADDAPDGGSQDKD